MKLIAATGNKGKLDEFKRILCPLGIEVISQKEAGAEIEVEENGKTFQENALIKAKAIYEKTLLPTLADDSGLCVDALNGRPGIYSARYCGENSTYTDKIAALLKEMEYITDANRTAYFIAHISCIIDRDTILECEGICPGTIGYKACGDGGFGFDPIFYVGEKSFAGLLPEEKDRVSHRGKALRELYKKLEEYKSKIGGKETDVK